MIRNLSGKMALVIGGIVMLSFAGGCQQKTTGPVTLEMEGIRNPSQDRYLYISGAVTGETLEQLRDEGVQTVIDLRMDDQKRPEDVPTIKGLGLKYVSLPMQSSGMTDAQAEAFLAAMKENGQGKVLLQCGSANRSGAMYGLYIGATHDCTIEEAMEYARRGGLRSDDLAADIQAYLEKTRKN